MDGYLFEADKLGRPHINGAQVTRQDFGHKWARGKRAYYAKGTAHQCLEKIMQPEDSAFRGRGTSGTSYTFRAHKRGFFHIESAETAGSDALGYDALYEINALKNVWNALLPDEIGAGRTVAGTAGRICRALAPIAGAQLPRDRMLAHAAVHQGPIAVCRGGADDCIEIDRIQAFLQGMREGVPLDLHPQPAADGLKILDGEAQGIMRAIVWVNPGTYRAALGPLPCRTSGGTVYPVGWVSGAWTLDVLRSAMIMGARIAEVLEVATCRIEKLHARAADAIDRVMMHEKKAGKLLYTRYWGRLANIGGWIGRTIQAPGSVKHDGSDLWWSWDGLELGGYAPADYQPAHAAFIASSNCLRMMRELDALPAEAVIAAHVDALWLDAAKLPPGWGCPPGFKVERRAPCRFMGVGTYRHGDHHAAQGCANGDDPATWAAWVAGMKPDPRWYRQWDQPGGARVSPASTSRPPIQDESCKWALPWGLPSIYDSGWTGAGWWQGDPAVAKISMVECVW